MNCRVKDAGNIAQQTHLELGVMTYLKYRVAQLDFTPEMEALYMLFERCHSKIERYLSISI